MSESREFDDRCVVITGAGNGLGRSYALLLGALGASVVVNDLGTTSARGEGSSTSAAQAVVDEIVAAGGRAVASADSVSTPSGGRAIIEAAMDNFGRVDAVINNAGIQRPDLFEDTTDENFDALLDVHLKGAFYVSRPAFRIMKSQKYGRLLFTASSAGLFGGETYTAYASAKAGLIGMMRTTSLEGAAFGIRSNIIMPAAITRMGAEGDVPFMARFQAAIEAIGAERFRASNPDFVAPLAAYLVSQSCESTGSMFSAVLGRYARVFIGLGDGWFGPADHPVDVTEVGSHFGQICETTPFVIPDHLVAEFEHLGTTLALDGSSASTLGQIA